MNIAAQKGTKVVYLDKGGYSSDKKHARKYLKKNKIYTVDHTEVDDFYTEVYLQEFPGVSFNSVMFQDIQGN
jgi:hypothetical protein